jgi:hypothetical protein
MATEFRKFLCLLTLMLCVVQLSFGQLSIQAVDVAGDSISKGFNASSSFPCSNGDQEQYNWMTSRTHGASFCGTGSENVFSVAERLECDFGTSILAANPNHAASGAQMLHDFLNQAGSIRTYLSAQSGNRLAAVFMGHNDNCAGVLTKTNTSCSSTDQDPNNYCKTKPDAFEREFRKGLDVLMSVGSTRIAVAAPVRVSQLCNFTAKSSCQLPASCATLWGTVSICASLTRDCSPTRIADTYTIMKAYRDILKSVTEEYAQIPNGGTSRVVFIGGEMVGGGVKAIGTQFVFSDAPWRYRFSADQISCCDCFHPSVTGQDTLARLFKNGLACSRIQACCKDTGDPILDGKCAKSEIKRSYYHGFF